MKIEKLPSGSYRVQKQISGKRYSFSFDHKPTQKEIAAAIDEIKTKSYLNDDLTFYAACQSYIGARTNTLSPSTVKEYKGTLERLPEEFSELLIDDITQNAVQRVVNELAESKSPKTVRNYHGFISAILGEFRPDLALHTRLPMRQPKEPYIPTREDIQTLLEAAKGTNYEVPILLGCASLRRGEICALTMDDIEGNIIHITKDTVLNEHNEWVVKPPKTATSIRDIYVPNQVLDAIYRNGLYSGHPGNITDWMYDTEKKLGLQKFSLHKCRHYFASAAHEAGVSDADIMKAGGWKTDHVMKSVYRHSLAKDNSAATSAVFKNLL